MKCRHCFAELSLVFADLGCSPPSNSYLTTKQLSLPETHYPLKALVCEQCWLVQTQDFVAPEKLFSNDYPYFSSTSASWMAHARTYAIEIVRRLALNSESFVVEVASNDGYLLRNFKEFGIDCLGVEPTDDTAAAAEALGIPVVREFLTQDLGEALAAGHIAANGIRGPASRPADLIVANNVFAHVPDVNDFAAGLAGALGRDGTITIEFPHVLELIRQCQFDTIYHEHYSYLSLHAAQRILRGAGLRLWDVEKLATHGGSLRVYAIHEDDPRSTLDTVPEVLTEEIDGGLLTAGPYVDFQPRAVRVKNNFLALLLEAKRSGTRVAAYGAAAKGNTLINFAGLRADLLPFVVDAAPSKQGKFLPGSRIPVLAPEALSRECADLVVVLPWNLISEIRRQLQPFVDAGGRLVTVVPELREYSLHGCRLRDTRHIP
jgi:hypothetical protein